RCGSPMRSAVRCPGARSPCDSSTTENSSKQGRQMTAKAEGEDKLILETTKGPVTIALRPDLAPTHVARIKELVGEGFYDGVAFHRVIDGFMAQTGCPQGTRSEEHTSELQSLTNLVCRLLLEKKNK